MEALAAAASVIAVIQIAQSVGSVLMDYYEDVRDARHDIQTLYKCIKSHQAVLDSLRDLLNSRHDDLLDEKSIASADGSKSGLLTRPDGPLKMSEVELLNLQIKLQHSSKDRKGFGSSLQSLKWPFKKKDVERTVGILEKHKRDLGLVVGMQSLNISSKHYDISEGIMSEIRTAQGDDDRRRIISWLCQSVPDTSIEHNIALQKHEETTGSWLLDGDEFNSWMKAPNSFFWLNAGAGAGKSILCSTAIDYLEKQCLTKPENAVVYWYFTFTDTEKQKVTNMLCSLISRICSNRRNTPQALRDGYALSNGGQQRPNNDTIMKMLKETICGFDDIYIIIDAVDECPRTDQERSKLLKVIQLLNSWGIDAVHLFVTSRREIDIQESFENIPQDLGLFSDVPVEGALVEKDIREYLGRRLQEDQFRRWSQSFKEEVLGRLTSQAGGMFRLVALQIEALGKERIDAKRRDAMDRLPTTLDKWYEEILRNIDKADKDIARRALNWLAFAARPISLQELAKAATIYSPRVEYPGSDNYIVDEDLDHYNDLLEILPAGLVTTFEVDQDAAKNPSLESEDFVGIRFAHFSVKEYLISTRIQLPEYGINEVSAHNMIAEACIAYLFHAATRREEIEYTPSKASGDSDSDSDSDSLSIQEREHTQSVRRRFVLLHYSARCWSYHMSKLENLNESLQTLVLEFLNYSSNAWHIWNVVAFEDESEVRNPDSEVSRTVKDYFLCITLVHPITWASCMGLESLLVQLLQAEPDLETIPQTPRLGSPLHAASYSGHIQIVNLLLSAGCDVNIRGGQYGLALQAAARSENLEVVSLLLQHGANINALGGYYGTALQAAASIENLEVVSLLLQHSANINAVEGYYGTALQAAARSENLEVVSLLLQHGANINALGGYYGTALQAAASIENLEVVSLLLQHGSETNIVGGVFGSALHAACAFPGGPLEVVSLLLDHGVDINMRDTSNATALHLASEGFSAEMVRLLLERGADVHLRNHDGKTALELVTLIPSQRVREMRVAASSIAEMLLQAGAGERLTDADWDTLMDNITLKGWYMRSHSRGFMKEIDDLRAVLEKWRLKTKGLGVELL